VQQLIFKVNVAGVGAGNLGNYPDERCFAGSVGPQQSKNTTRRNFKSNVLQGQMIRVLFTDSGNFEYAQGGRFYFQI
jgi:hypothetical protein